MDDGAAKETENSSATVGSLAAPAVATSSSTTVGGPGATSSSTTVGNLAAPSSSATVGGLAAPDTVGSPVAPARMENPSSSSEESSNASSTASEESLPSSPVAPEMSPLTSETNTSSASDMLDQLEGFTAVPTRILTYPTMKIVGDNIDKYVKPREMREDVQASMLHYFNLYAVRDRVDASTLEDAPSLPDPSRIDLDKLFPSPEEHKAIHKNFQHLVARVLKKHMPFFKKFGSGLERHLKHKYYKEMSMKSEVVSGHICASLILYTNYILLIVLLSDSTWYFAKV